MIQRLKSFDDIYPTLEPSIERVRSKERTRVKIQQQSRYQRDIFHQWLYQAISSQINCSLPLRKRQIEIEQTKKKKKKEVIQSSWTHYCIPPSGHLPYSAIPEQSPIYLVALTQLSTPFPRRSSTGTTCPPPSYPKTSMLFARNWQPIFFFFLLQVEISVVGVFLY